MNTTRQIGKKTFIKKTSERMDFETSIRQYPILENSQCRASGHGSGRRAEKELAK